MPKRTCTGLARTPDCRAAWPTWVGRLAARTVKRPESATIREVFQPLGGCFFRIRRSKHQKHAGRKVPQPDAAQIAQESHHRHRARDDPVDIGDTQLTPALYRSRYRLRRHECEAERATLDQTAQGHRPSAAGRRQNRPAPALDSPLNSRGRAQRLYKSRVPREAFSRLGGQGLSR